MSADPDPDPLWVDPPPPTLPRPAEPVRVREADEFLRWKDEAIRRLERRELVAQVVISLEQTARGGWREDVKSMLVRELERVAERDGMEFEGLVRFDERDETFDGVTLRARAWAVPRRELPPLLWERRGL